MFQEGDVRSPPELQIILTFCKTLDFLYPYCHVFFNCTKKIPFIFQGCATDKQIPRAKFNYCYVSSSVQRTGILNTAQDGPGSSVGIATRYGLDGPGIKYR
jgi:hypothetical protein